MKLRRLGQLVSLLAFITWILLFFRSRLVVVLPSSSTFCDTERDVPPVPPTNYSKVAKVTVATNSLNTSIIHRALNTHQVQNEMHGYTHHITTEDLVSDLSEHDKQHRPRGAWSKPAYLLSIIIAELTKPKDERLEWIFWFDADTIVLNPHTSLETFLPPPSISELSNIHLLISSNWDGVNSGAFAFRVHPWSVSVLSTILAYPVYQSRRSNTDRFRDQSAFQWLLQPNRESPLYNDPMKGKRNWADVPMRWFNSLPINNAFAKDWDWIFNHNMTDAMFDNGTHHVYHDGNGPTVKPWKVMRGDMLVHFAGANPVRDSWMGRWLERAEQYLPEWSNATTEVGLKTEAYDFWEKVGDRISKERARAARMSGSKKQPFMEQKPVTSARTGSITPVAKSPGKELYHAIG